MATIAQIRHALAAAIQAVAPGELQVEPTIGAILSNPHPPYAHVYPCGDAGDFEYDQAMARGLDVMPFTVEVFTGSPMDIAAQTNLDAFLDPAGGKSLKAALEVDKTLGGLVDDLQVTKCIGYRAVALPRAGGGEPLLAATWLLQVFLGDAGDA